MNSLPATATPDAQIWIAEGLLEQRRLTEAWAAFDAAAALGADQDRCSAGRWTAAMLCGRFEAAWRESDAIRRRGSPDPHRFWMGEELRGKSVIVRCLHGFGDAIQFLRYVPQLNATANQVVVEVPPRLLPLAPMLGGVGEVVTWGAGVPARAPVWDVQVEVMELPYMFRTTVEDLPIVTNYLCLQDEDVRRAAELMGIQRKPSVGLVWAAGGWNPERSMPIELLEKIVSSGCAEFWSLQGGKESEAAAAWIRSGRMRDSAVCGDGLRGLAAVIANLDLVISVDTLAVHMAGAMGKPVWVLLQHAADWRWMTDRDDSPWYPTAKLFRQENAGDWKSVLDRVEVILRNNDARNELVR